MSRKNYQRFVLILILILITPFFLFSISKNSDYSRGPLYGKNVYIPYLIYYSFPGIRASQEKRYSLNYHISTYYSNDFHLEQIYLLNNGKYQVKYGRDYESLIAEIGLSFTLLKNLTIGIDTRLISYYGGFLDPFIQGFHYAFSLPNAGREYAPQNEVHIDISNNNNIPLYLNEASVAFGDIDTWLKYNFYQNRRIVLVIAGLITFGIVIVTVILTSRIYQSELQNIEKAIEQLNQNDFRNRMEYRKSDEFEPVFSGLNQLFDKVIGWNTSYKQSEKKIKTILQAIHEGLMIIDGNMKIVSFNQYLSF